MEQNDKCIKVENVEAIFKGIKEEGELLRYYEQPTMEKIGHIQGCAKYIHPEYGELFFISYNYQPPFKTGNIYMLWHDKNGKTSYSSYETRKGYLHPGGLQVIGNYLFCAVETKDYKDSYIEIYEITVKKGEKPQLTALNPFERKGEGAGMVGITNYTTASGEERYVMVIGCGRSMKVYLSDSDNLKTVVAKSKFTECFRTNLSDVLKGKDIDDTAFQCLNLITDVSNTIYLVGFQSITSGASYADYAFLLKVDIEACKIDYVNHRHMKTTGIDVGIFKPHFRWGSCVHILTFDCFDLITTERNPDTNKTDACIFKYPNSKSNVFHLKVKTSDESKAGTDDNIFIKLQSKEKTSNWIYLDGKMERGDLDEFDVRTDNAGFGAITHISLVKREELATFAHAWKCDYIEITEPKGSTRKFRIYDWIDDEKERTYTCLIGNDDVNDDK